MEGEETCRGQRGLGTCGGGATNECGDTYVRLRACYVAVHATKSKSNTQAEVADGGDRARGSRGCVDDLII